MLAAMVLLDPIIWIPIAIIITLAYLFSTIKEASKYVEDMKEGVYNNDDENNPRNR
jgi:hypothetical protein